MEGWIAGSVTGVIFVIVNWTGFAIWFGRHKERHVVIDDKLLMFAAGLEEINRKHEDTQSKCPIDVVQHDQTRVIKSIDQMQVKLDGLISRTTRIESLENMMSLSATDRIAIHQKLDAVASKIDEIRGAFQHVQTKGGKFDGQL